MHLEQENENVENKKEEKEIKKSLEQSSGEVSDDEILQLERLADLVLDFMFSKNSQEDE